MDLVNPRPLRDEVWLVALDPTHGAEIQKTRPCLVISPDEMNHYLQTVIVVPMTTTVRPYPSRVPIRFQGKTGQLALDQIRAVDRVRLIRRLGAVSSATAHSATTVLLEIFRRS
jgi:mRNA interferase MazF